MKSITLIFPHQLFQDHPAVAAERDVFLVEEHLYFNQFSFHKHKLFFHRASMLEYKKHLENLQINVHYIEAQEAHADVRKLVIVLKNKGVEEICYADVTDNWLSRPHSRFLRHLCSLKL